MTVFIDLEPRVIHGIQSSAYRDLYNPENFFVAKEGIYIIIHNIYQKPQ